MKKIILLLTIVTFCTSLLGQVPRKMSYQSVVRNAQQQVVSDTQVGLRLSLLQGSEAGAEVYSETQIITTNANGLMSAEFGGEPGFDEIDWAQGPWFIKTEIDPAGGSNYVITGVNKLMTVPYAYHAHQGGTLDYEQLTGLPELFDAQWESLEGLPLLPTDISELTDQEQMHIPDGNLEHQMMYWQGDHWAVLPAGDPGKMLYFCDGIPRWGPCPVGVEDVDGNVYPTLVLGLQEWMTENLRTTRFNDGTQIDYPTNDLDWWNNTTGAFAWYEDDTIWGEIYGGLYNWYAASSENLCPAGWRVPADQDWTQLVNYLMDEYDIDNDYTNPDALGNALKTCRQLDSPLGGECDTNQHPRWNSHHTHFGKDLFGFNALPGGVKNPYGIFATVGTNGHYWSSKESDDDNAFRRNLNSMYGDLSRFQYNKRYGLSVRCMRDVGTSTPE